MTAAVQITTGAGMEANREYFIGVGRRAALKAFRHDRRYSESPIAYFDGAHRPKAPKRTASKPRTQVMHAVATRPSGYSKPNLVDNQAITGFIHRAIAELPPLEFLWVQYRYRPEGLARTQHGENFLRDYFRQYDATRLVGCKTGTRRMVRYLISVAMENESHPARREVRPEGHDIETRNWNKTYRPHWFRVCAEISAIDSSAMYHLGLMVDREGVA